MKDGIGNSDRSTVKGYGQRLRFGMVVHGNRERQSGELHCTTFS